MELFLPFIFLLCVPNINGVVLSEIAPVTDPIMKELGYSCMPVAYFNLGPMRAGELKAYSCAEALCEANGQVIHLGCAFWTVANDCDIIDGNPEKPYPHCCPRLKCREELN